MKVIYTVLLIGIMFLIVVIIERKENKRNNTEIDVVQYQQVVKWSQDYPDLSRQMPAYLSDDIINQWEFNQMKINLNDVEKQRYKNEIIDLVRSWKIRNDDIDKRNKK